MEKIGSLEMEKIMKQRGPKLTKHKFHSHVTCDPSILFSFYFLFFSFLITFKKQEELKKVKKKNPRGTSLMGRGCHVSKDQIKNGVGVQNCHRIKT